MGHVPSDVRWFVADLVIEIEVEGDDRNVVHKNLVLVEARSPEEAYQRALQLGHEEEIVYDNPSGKSVKAKFRGISELAVVGAELKHGTEVLYQEYVAVPEDKIRQWLRSKRQLSAFLPIEPSSGPDYASGEIMREVEKMIYGKSRK